MYEKLDFPVCVYCGETPEHWEHVYPNSKGKHIRSGYISWILPACKECNYIAGAKVFKTFGDKRRFIQASLTVRYYDILDTDRMKARLAWRIETIDDMPIVQRVKESIVVEKKKRKTPKKVEKLVGLSRQDQLLHRLSLCNYCKKKFVAVFTWRLFCCPGCERAWMSRYAGRKSLKRLLLQQERRLDEQVM